MNEDNLKDKERQSFSTVIFVHIFPVITFPTLFDIGQSHLIFHNLGFWQFMCVCLNATRVCRKKNWPIARHPLHSIRKTLRVEGWKIAPL